MTGSVPSERRQNGLARICGRQGCNAFLVDPRANQRFCSPNCRRRAFDQRKSRAMLASYREKCELAFIEILEEYGI